MNIESTLYNISVMSTWTALATIAVITVVAGLSGKPLHSPTQAISHIIFGKQSYQTVILNILFTSVGFLLNAGAMIMWCSIAEIAFRAIGQSPRNAFVAILVALGITVGSYIVDFHLVPKRFTPGFEHIIEKRGLLIVYSILGISLFCGALGRIG